HGLVGVLDLPGEQIRPVGPPDAAMVDVDVARIPRYKRLVGVAAVVEDPEALEFHRPGNVTHDRGGVSKSWACSVNLWPRPVDAGAGPGPSRCWVEGSRSLPGRAGSATRPPPRTRRALLTSRSPRT